MGGKPQASWKSKAGRIIVRLFLHQQDFPQPLATRRRQS
jgi:hypothetical protein